MIRYFYHKKEISLYLCVTLWPVMALCPKLSWTPYLPLWGTYYLVCKSTVILLIFITKVLYNVCFALHEFSSVPDLRDGISKVPIVISALQCAYCHQCFAKHLLLSVLCNVPIVISALQSAYCHQCFAKRLLSSVLCNVPIVISALQSACCHHCQSKYIKKVKHSEPWCFLGSDCESSSWRCRQHIPLKHWYLSTTI